MKIKNWADLFAAHELLSTYKKDKRKKRVIETAITEFWNFRDIVHIS